MNDKNLRSPNFRYCLPTSHENPGVALTGACSSGFNETNYDWSSAFCVTKYTVMPIVVMVAYLAFFAIGELYLFHFCQVHITLDIIFFRQITWTLSSPLKVSFVNAPYLIQESRYNTSSLDLFQEVFLMFPLHALSKAEITSTYISSKDLYYHPFRSYNFIKWLWTAFQSISFVFIEAF